MAVAKALIEKFCKSKPFSSNDLDDLLQEVLTHWFSQRDTYDSSKPASRKTYMNHVVRRKLIDLLEARETDKRKILDQTLSLDRPLSDDESSPTLGETIEAAESPSPQAIELKIDIASLARELTPCQNQVLRLRLEGFSITEISEKLGKHKSTVYGDIHRMRRLLERIRMKEYLK